jgi:hypothetical protein
VERYAWDFVWHTFIGVLAGDPGEGLLSAAIGAAGAVRAYCHHVEWWPGER